DICGPVYVWILVTLGKTQISKNYIIKGIGYLPAQFARLFGLHAIRLSAYISRRSKEKKEKLNNRIKNNELRSYLYIAMSVSEEEARKLITPKRYRKLLEKERLETDSQYAIAHQLFSAGKLNLACETFIDLIENAFEDLSIDRRLQLYRDCGIAHFMHGKIHEAKKYWALAGELKRFILGPVDKSTYRIIGNSWFVAIGHVALLDYYLKYVLLFRNSTSRTIIQHDITNIPGSYLLNKFKGSGIEFLNPNDPAALESDYNSWANQNGKQLWAQLSVAEKAAHIDDFWEFEFPDNQILGYAHAAARIQNEWEHRALPPLLHITKEERKFVYSALKLFGIPQKAWYVCLHVREPGFHKQWNKLYPSMRDADIDDYKLAIEKIVKSGGWVIRMGDPTMKKLPKMKGVVDYAHSPHKTNTADILIPLCCRFFLGTNSGYSTIPHIYGIRCAFTNWVPIGLPLWSKRDLMIPKLFQNQKDQKFLGLEEIFETGLAFVQNWADLPKGISLVENSPEEIKDLTQEMLSITDKNAVVKENSIGVLFQDKYRQMAEHHGGYAGSQIGSAFIENHPDIFPIATTYEKTPMNSLKKGKDVSDLYVAIASSGEDIKKFIDPNHYQKMLKGERLDAEIQYSIAHQLSSKGKLKLACETFVDLIENVIIDLPLERRLQLYRDCGIAYFLCGNNHETKKYWTLAGKLRRFILGPTEKKTYRIIGNSWFAAIGHVCMLDYYLKYIKLFRDSSSRTVIQQNIGTVPGSYLLSKFNGKDIEFLDSNKPEDLEKDYNSWAEKNGKRTWNNITASEKAAHIDDFWEFEFPDGEILGYTHA
ncbi:MAG: TIGR04372 family glycosyltransferase, partial [Bacteroidetes bacterium]|nr:TIGR04372 family glycosyltransferase [Bacteroidota bacterium]